MKTFKKLMALFCTAAILFTSLSVGTVFAADSSTTDYSNINFDTENGTTGNLNSSYWSFFDGNTNVIGGNATNMLKVKTDKAGNLAAYLLLNGSNVKIEAGKSYSIAFDYYADSGVDLTGFTIRDSGAIVTDKSDSWGTVKATTLGISSTGTDGEWKRIKAYFTADEDADLKIGVTPKTATTDVYVYFDNFSLIEMPAEVEGDYSNINFDTLNGVSGNLNSGYWSFYDGGNGAIAGNESGMLKVKTDKTGNLEAYLTYGSNNVPIESGKTYAMAFDYYADAGIDLEGITIRDTGAIVTDKSNSWGTIKADTLGITSEGTDGAWKRIKVYFTADENAYLKIGVTPKTATADVYMYFDNFSFVEISAETEGDYSNITFDTANGVSGNLNSSYWSFYDGGDGAVAGNESRMLKVKTDKAGNLEAYLTYGSNNVPIVSGKTYAIAFDYYADSGVDLTGFTVRDSGAIVTDKSDSWGTVKATTLGITSAGTDGAWKRIKLYFTADENADLKIGVTPKTATTDAYVYFDNFSVVEMPAEATDDYSDITFDTANGTAGTLGSSYVAFYDAYENGIAGNYTRMLRYYAKGTDNAQFNITYGADNVALVAGQRYRVDFDIYAESGIDIGKATLRDQSACLKDNVLLPITSTGTDGKWVRFTAFFTAGTDSTSFKMSIQSNSATNKYLYIDNISLTPFDSEGAITFEGKTDGAAVDASTSVWRYSSSSIAGNDTTKLVYSYNGQASGSVYNDFGEAIAVEKGYYYIIKFDYYIDAYSGTLGAVYNTEIGYKCNLEVTPEEGTGGVWKTSTTVLKTTGSTEQFKFSINPTVDSTVSLYFDNVSIAQLYDCYEIPEVESVAPGKLAVSVVDGYEYSLDGVHFNAEGVFTELYSETGIYPLYCREAVTDNGYPSAISEAIYIQLPYAGDINNDRILNADDLVQMRSRLLDVATEIDDAFFDANIDTLVDVRDIVNLKKQVADEKDITSELDITRNGVNYSLAWNDDFTGSYIDRNKWADRVSNAASELQVFENDADNLFMDNDVDGNSCLILQAVKETDDEGNVTYTSGGIDTYGKFDFNRGYVEMRAKMPKGAGLWPGFWFGGTSNRDGESSWPENGEIDVFEYYGYKPDTVYHNFHYATYDENGEIVANKIRNEDDEYFTTISGNFYDEFHTFGCEWTEEYVAFYVDGNLRCRYIKDADTFAEINNEDMYLLVTLAVGGSDEAIADIGNTEFPAQMAVDYVRYYK